MGKVARDEVGRWAEIGKSWIQAFDKGLVHACHVINTEWDLLLCFILPLSQSIWATKPEFHGLSGSSKVDILFSQFWRLRSPWIKALTDLVSGEGKYTSGFTESWILAGSSQDRRREVRGLSGALIPLLRAVPVWPSHLPKGSPPNTITVGIRF